MAVKRGTDGLIEVSADGGSAWAVVASQQNWSVDQTNENIDVTVLGAQRDRSTITTFRQWSMTADGFWDTDDQAAALGQGIVQAYADSGEALDIRITPSATGGNPETTGDWYYTGTAYVTSDSPSGGFDTAVQLSLAFEGTGPLTFDVF